MNGQQPLFAGTEPASPAERKHRNGTSPRHSALSQAVFDRWWKSYPPGRGRGPRQTALVAWCRTLGRGTLVVELERQLSNYVAARHLYREHYGADAPLMHGATFLNSKGSLFDVEWSLDDVLGWWPAPDGWKRKRETASERARRILDESEAM